MLDSMGPTLEAAFAALADRTLVHDLPRAALIEHAASFPSADLHKLFFEWEWAEGSLRPAGYGHGFRPRALARLLAQDSAFAQTPRGEQILLALRQDPFDPSGERSRSSQDGEPEWIEYDLDARGVAELPGVFFALPSELRRIQTPEDARALLDALELRLPEFSTREDRLGQDDSNDRSLRKVVAELAQAELALANPLRVYRLGRSENRAPGWLRLLIGGLRPTSLDDLAPRLLGDYDSTIAGRIAAATPELARPRITAAIDVLEGRLAAIDLEGPYFFGLRDAATRAARTSQFCASLAHAGLLGDAAARAIAAIGLVEVELPDFDRRAVLVVDHFKFGVAGRHLGRIKLYAELVIWRSDRPGPLR